MTTEQTGATIAPAQPSLSDALLPLVAPVAQQAVQQATAELQQRLASVESQLAANLSQQAPKLEAYATTIGTDVLNTVEHDTLTQRVIVWAIVGVALAAALIILIAALVGNSTALRWIGAAPAVVGAAVLWVSRTGTELPKRTGMPTPGATP